MIFNKKKLLGSVTNDSYYVDVAIVTESIKGRYITSKDIIKYFSNVSKILKASTRQRRKVAIKHACMAYHGYGLKPIRRAKIEYIFKKILIPTDKWKSRDYFTEIEIEEICRNSGKRTRLIIKALYETALRVSELCSIRKSECERIGEQYKISVICKGGVVGVVYMESSTYCAIDKIYQGETYLFETSPGRHISRHTISTMLKRTGEKFGVNLYPHKIRRSFASNMVKKYGIIPVSKYLLHSDPGYTAKNYINEKEKKITIMR
jgi:integrase